MKEPTTQEIVDRAASRIQGYMLWLFGCQALLTLAMVLMILAKLK